MKRIILFFILNIGLQVLNAQTNTWTGTADSDWHKGCNWSLGIVPTCTHSVVIPSSTTNKPIITGVASCYVIDIQGVASTLLTIATGALLQVDLCPTPNTVNASGKYVFLSNNAYDSNTPVATRDAACNTDGSALLGGTYKAWVYNPATGLNNVPSTGGACGYKKPNGTVVASSWADLTDGTLTSPINMLANQTLVTDWVYTGLTAGGVSSGSHCSGWTDWSAFGTYGRSDQTGTGWSAWSADQCGSQTTSPTWNCGSTSYYIGPSNPLDDCSCWPGTSIASYNVVLFACYISNDCPPPFCPSPAPPPYPDCWPDPPPDCGSSSFQRCCTPGVPVTTTNYESRRHYCFQQ